MKEAEAWDLLGMSVVHSAIYEPWLAARVDMNLKTAGGGRMKDFEYRGWRVMRDSDGRYEAQGSSCGILFGPDLARLLESVDTWEDGPRTGTEVIKESGRVFDRSVFFCPRCKREGLASVYRWLESTDRLGRPGQDVCTECANHQRLGTPDPKFFCSLGRK